MNTDLLGLELRLAQARDEREREQVVAHALNEVPHDPWWLFVAARLVEARAEPAGDALAMLAQRVKAHLLGPHPLPDPAPDEDVQATIDILPELPDWAIELLRWCWTREALDELAATQAMDAADEAAQSRHWKAQVLSARALRLPPPVNAAAAAAGDAPAPAGDAASERGRLRMRWVGDSLWRETLCASVRIELGQAEADSSAVSEALESLSTLAALGDEALQETRQRLGDHPWVAHVLDQWILRRTLPADARPLRRLSDLRERFHQAVPADLALARKAAEVTCERELARCEMLRTYLDHQESWLVHAGDLLLPAGVLRADVNLIITGDLVCETWTDTDVVVIVLGSMRCRSIYSSGGLCVVGDVIARGVILQHYNDWAFEVLGKVSARALVSLDKMVHLDESRAVYEYSPSGPLLRPQGDMRPRSASAWLAIDPERDVREQIDELCAQEQAGQEALPPAAPPESRSLSAFDARQRALVEGRAGEAMLLTLLDDARWTWEMVSLLPDHCLTPSLRALLARDAQVRVRCAAVARLAAEDLSGFAAAVQDHEPAVRAELARHPACPALLWAGLARDASALVRAAWLQGRLAQGEPLPPELALHLAQDEEVEVRRALACAASLPTTVALALLEDADEGVRLRIGQQPLQSVEVLERMATDPSPSVRLALAGMAYDWRAPFDRHPGLARRLREQLVRDAEPAVRRAAAFGLTPPFIEAHGERFAADPVAEIRRLVAGCTRERTLQQQLLRDDDAGVRRALIDNPHLQADLLLEMARTLPAGSLFEPDDSLDRLAEHPRLGEEAMHVIHQRVSNDHGHLFDEQPRAPLDLVVARLVHDHPYDPGDEEYTAYEGLRQRFPALAAMHAVMADVEVRQGWPRRLMEAGIAYPRRWYHRIFFVAGFVALTLSMTFRARKKIATAQAGGEPVALTDDDLAAIAQEMLDSTVYAIRSAILGNQRCPPAALAEYVRDYLARCDDPGALSDYTIRQVVANPSLPIEAMGQVVAHLCRTDNHELRTGLLRNTAMPEALFTQLLGASSPDVRDAAREGLWRVHGEWVG